MKTVYTVLEEIKNQKLKVRIFQGDPNTGECYPRISKDLHPVHIVKIVNKRDREVLWEHPNFHMPEIPIHYVVDGIDFETETEAKQHITYLKGERL